MVPMVIFKPDRDYIDYALDDFSHLAETVVCVNSYPFRIGGFTYRLSMLNRSLRGGRSENFPRTWLRGLLRTHGIRENQEVAFCFINSALEYYHVNFMEWVRSIWPKARLYGIVLDTITDEVKDSVLPRLAACDAVYSFDLRDSKAYGFRHFWGLMPTVDKSWFHVGLSETCIYDLCFIGDDRGRYDELKSLYTRLKKEDIRCLFRILTRRRAEDTVDEEIMIREMIPFREVLRMEGSSHVLLDYGWLKHGNQGLSLRVMDAVGLGRAVITNSHYMVSCPIYRSDAVAIVKDLNEITADGVRTLAFRVPITYEHTDIFSGRNLTKGIEEDFARGNI